MNLDDYIIEHSEPEHPYLHQLWRATNLHLNYPRMASGHIQGQLLRMLVLMLRPHRILELGTFTGYSALAMASALQPGDQLHTIELYDEQEDFTRPWLEGSPWADRVTLHMGDALQLLRNNAPFLQGPETFDLIFIDADKRHYTDYLQAVLPYLRPGGFILADNTLWGDQVLNTAPQKTQHNGKEAQLQGIIAFNNLVATDPRLETLILPIRDGLSIIRKK